MGIGVSEASSFDLTGTAKLVQGGSAATPRVQGAYKAEQKHTSPQHTKAPVGDLPSRACIIRNAFAV